MTYDVRFSDGTIGYGLTQSDRDYWDSIGEIYTVIAEHPASSTDEDEKSSSATPWIIGGALLLLGLVAFSKFRGER
jgi:hypothetical protein